MDGLTRGRGAVRRNGRVEEEESDMDVTLINFLYREIIYSYLIQMCGFSGASHSFIIIITTNKKVCAQEKYSDQLNLASPSKTKVGV